MWKKKSIWAAIAALLSVIVAVKTGVPATITQPVIEQAGCTDETGQ